MHYVILVGRVDPGWPGCHACNREVDLDVFNGIPAFRQTGPARISGLGPGSCNWSRRYTLFQMRQTCLMPEMHSGLCSQDGGFYPIRSRRFKNRVGILITTWGKKSKFRDRIFAKLSENFNYCERTAQQQHNN